MIRSCGRSCAIALLLCALAASKPAHAGGPLGIDHRWSLDESGIWGRNVQIAFIGTLVAGETIGALWEGGNSRLGNTLWKSIDATALSGASAVALKYAFSRQRPLHTADPGRWFQGSGNASFPSGEVTITAAIVTPIVLEYGREHPLVYALELLPLYDGIARLKAQEHWQSDVVAGFVLGTAVGYVMHRRRDSPLILGALPHGFYLGLGRHW